MPYLEKIGEPRPFKGQIQAWIWIQDVLKSRPEESLLMEWCNPFLQPGSSVGERCAKHLLAGFTGYRAREKTGTLPVQEKDLESEYAPRCQQCFFLNGEWGVVREVGVFFFFS